MNWKHITTQTNIRSHKHTQTHARTHTHTHTYTHTIPHIHTRTHIPVLLRPQFLLLVPVLQKELRSTYTQTIPDTHTEKMTNTNTHTHTHIHTTLWDLDLFNGGPVEFFHLHTGEQRRNACEHADITDEQTHTCTHTDHRRISAYTRESREGMPRCMLVSMLV
jgi:hypothetical protein